jgi:hypothetical protein
MNFELVNALSCVKDGSGNPFCPDFYRAKRLGAYSLTAGAAMGTPKCIF